MAEYKNKMNIEADAQLEERLVAVNRVTKVTKGGKISSTILSIVLLTMRLVSFTPRVAA